MNTRKKLRTLFSIDPRWAIRFARKRANHYVTYLWSKSTGRRYWEVEIGGITLKLAFFSPYHHRIAYFMYKGAFEDVLLSLWLEEATKHHIIYDIGGYNGIYGLVAAKSKPEARVVIFEPDPVNARHIRANIEINALSNCRLEEVAISDHSGGAFFAANGSTGAHLADTGISVQCKTLDEYPPADLIKIDVEGAECEVLRGGRVVLRSKPTVFVEVHNWIDHEQFWKQVRDFGYRSKKVNEEYQGAHYLLN